MMKFLLLASTLLCGLVANGQKVSLKKGNVFFDGRVVMTYDREMMGNITNFYDVKTKNMLLTFSFENNGTHNYQDDDFTKLYFYETNTLVETKKLRGLYPKNVLERMRKMGVVNDDGVFDAEKVEGFKNQYHEEYIRIQISR